MSDNFRQAAIFHGFDFNAHDGAYKNGKSYGHEKKIEVATSLIAAQNARGARPNISAIQKQCRVGWHFVRKVEKNSIHDEINTATEFSVQVELEMSSVFFYPGDVMVLDNATIHSDGENSVLEDWLWDRFGVFVLFLPARSPEFNPIELVWNTLVARLKNVPLDELYAIGSDCS
eukprot:CAMPEP_0172316252 /NCGR_PEP_ID=MMETSP1058-20130122/27605_1 /TAXON_ID=83371 /ORGANISM="Detonula confervacea, Strain CCMP 353" /LENGTH=173 /DNA_ID=CAMNT_0013030521 /DNA_START=69 /DNA_END=586 /DNA_ORIENTATION=+